MAISFKAVVPARFASTRLPGKPLLDLGGKPMVVRVAERARESGAEEVCVATDHAGVAEAVRDCGFDVVMTSASHHTGTDRLAEVCELKGWGEDTLIVNVQGDEPLIAPELVASMASQLARTGAAIATVGCPIREIDDFLNPNVVKLVRRDDGDALYFSRAPIPWPRDEFAGKSVLRGCGLAMPSRLNAVRHIGLYAYRASFLRVFARLSPSPLESVEALEQLRALHHGFRISVLLSDEMPAPGVDTPEDARAMQALFAERLGTV